MAENPKFPDPNNVLLNGMETFQFDERPMPMLTPYSRENEQTFVKNLCDESPPWSVRTPANTSTPVVSRPNKQVINVPTCGDKLSLRKFSGYSHEDAAKFMAEFNSYCVFHDLDANEARKIAAFHLHLQGPALVWFGQLSEFIRTSWRIVSSEFQRTYTSKSPLDPTLIMESAMFNSLCLSPTQPLEDFYSIILEKGRKLGKPERDLMNKFVEGLPQQLAFYVRAGRCTSFADTLTAAKTGEAFGYRQTPASTAAIRTQSASDVSMNFIVKELSRLSTAVQHLATQEYGGQPPQRLDPAPQQSANSKCCFRCRGVGHVQRACALKDGGVSDPNSQCPFCSQFGHNAASCMFTKSENSRAPRRDQQGAPSGRR